MTDTPETDAAYKNHPWDMHDNIPLEFARKLERERDKYWDQSDYFLEQLGHTQIRMYDAERERDSLKNLHNKNATHSAELLDLCNTLQKERDEAVRSCHIWQKGHAELVAERDYLLNQLQVNQPERKHIGRWGHNRQEFTSPYINQTND